MHTELMDSVLTQSTNTSLGWQCPSSHKETELRAGRLTGFAVDQL